MKRYEKMTKEEIVKLYQNVGKCTVCYFKERCEDHTLEGGCGDVFASYLTEELTPRVANIHTLEEMKKEKWNFENICRSRWCADCPYKDTDDDCFLVYLYEVEE